MKTKNFIIFTLLFISSLACDDLVDVKPKGFIIPETAADLRLLLNNVYTGFSEKRPVTIGYDLVNYAGDQCKFENSDNVENGSGQDAYAYYMRDVRLIESNNYGAISQLYELISLTNVVLDIFPTTTDLSTKERHQIKGEALVHRAYSYLIMVNTHARHYDALTAASDPGVPMPLTHDIALESIPRSSVADVYAQILKDLETATKLLSPSNNNRATPSIGSAYALLARTHLYMGHFDLALAYAKHALQDVNYLCDYKEQIAYETTYDSEKDSTYVDSTKYSYDIPNRTWNNKEVILFKWCHEDYKSNASRFISYEFYQLFDKKDLRLKHYSQQLGRLKFSYDTKAFSGVLSSEMYLTIAECYARANQLDSALNTLNDLREHRFMAKDFSPISLSTRDEVMNAILVERQLELAWTGLRWFDMKRLNKEAKYAKTLIRTYKDETLIFEPNSDLWVFPFPGKILIDGVIEQNP